MEVTEREAKEGKWCFRQNVSEVGAELMSCMAAGCMAWRWSEPLRRRVIETETGNEVEGGPEPPRPSTVPASWEFCPADSDPACWIEPVDEASARRTGFCGLAGGQL